MEYLSRWRIARGWFPTSTSTADYNWDISYYYRGQWVVSSADYWWAVPYHVYRVWRNIE